MSNPINQQETNKATVLRFVEEVKNQRKFENMDKFFAPDYLEHNATVASFGTGTEGYKNFLKHLFSAYPDDVLTIEFIFAENDRVGYRASETATNTGEFLGIPATGKKATWTEIQFFRFDNGKIVEHWVDVDIYAWFLQIGVIPSNQ
jgi:steroid delta-isomerase-like uncharacterized protein